MEEPIQLSSNINGNTRIYTQKTGENIPYEELSPVSRARLDAMYQIWLDYLMRELGKIDPVAFSRGEIRADMIVKDESEQTTE